MLHQYMLHNRQSQSCATSTAATVRIYPVETFGQTWQVFRINPNSGIFYDKIGRFTIIMPAHGHGSTFRRVLDGIGNQVTEGTGNFHI